MWIYKSDKLTKQKKKSSKRLKIIIIWSEQTEQAQKLWKKNLSHCPREINNRSKYIECENLKKKLNNSTPPFNVMRLECDWWW